MKTTHHSEYLKLQSVFLKSVNSAFVSENELTELWQALNYLEQPDFDTSIKEYKVFEDFFKTAKNK